VSLNARAATREREEEEGNDDDDDARARLSSLGARERTTGRHTAGRVRGREVALALAHATPPRPATDRRRRPTPLRDREEATTIDPPRKPAFCEGNYPSVYALASSEESQALPKLVMTNELRAICGVIVEVANIAAANDRVINWFHVTRRMAVCHLNT